MTSTVLAALLAASVPPTLPEPEQVQADQGALRRAEDLFRKGSTLYEATEYLGAIAAFTEALAIVQDLPDAPVGTKLSLLYNIAAAREKQYEIDRDPQHLRQALQLYRRYEAESADVGDQLDAGARRMRIEKMLRELDATKNDSIQAPSPPLPLPRPRSADSDLGRRHRDIGIGLLVPGAAAVVGGVVVAIVGSTYEPRARSSVSKLADLGVPPDHPAWEEGDRFIAAERRKGVALMATGGSLAAVGAVLCGVGIYSMVKAKRTRTTTANVVFSDSFVGVRLLARF